MKIVKAEYKDLSEILKLQYLAYQSEAALFGTDDIPPLKETLEEVQEEYNSGVVLKMVSEDDSIIGSVRAKEANGYKKFKQEAVTDELIFVYMEKN